ncbi:hypothetical protein DM02DRAFT_550171 [Periconia macrospinosa]|uniref:Uncharacterized protein n=1 Tax=Periconia macrospinosa TaxID=97972 RepID=A0A2V1EF57_9PLEO|nr:hypothetical protein DM02DRAFT_550171 [Periconia macrospinosa]
MPTLRYKAITKRDFDTILSRYPSIVPDKLRQLDQLRYESIPATAAQRKAAQRDDGESTFLRKEEVEKLVEWKLSHGTFRPKLLQLVLSNEASAIEKATRDAFETISPHAQQDQQQDRKKGDAPLKAATQHLTSLRGIGPATASLLLSVQYPDTIPFFSDELFRWVMWDEKDGGGKMGKWKRQIKYNGKEYDELAQRVGDLVGRLGVRAIDCERVAWVLGKEGVDLDSDADVQGGEGESKDTLGEEEDGEGVKGVDEATVQKEKKKGTKRKVVEGNGQPVEGVRRSTRRKKEV